MDGRCREIGQPARVIEVEVRQKDVFYLCRIVTQRFDLPDGRLIQVTGTAAKARELPHDWRRGDAITHSPAGINQRQPVAGVDEQTMDHTVSPLEESSAVVLAGKPKRAHRSTVEVVNLHSDPPHLPSNTDPDPEATQRVEAVSPPARS
jgi:hypothetical protein